MTERTTTENEPVPGDPEGAPEAARGLSMAEVQERRAAGLGNVGPHTSSRPLRDIVRSNVVTSFNLALGTLWLLMVLSGAPFQDWLFGIIIVVNSGIGIIQEYRARRTLERLSVIGEARPVVRRDGRDASVRPGELVKDDVVVLATGDQVVVDGTLLSSTGIELDESLLTGEAEAVRKQVGEELRSGSFVVAGHGVMLATSVGVESYASRLTSEARQFKPASSELMRSTMRFVRIMSYLLVPLGLLLFRTQLEVSPDWRSALTGTVAGVVTMIPEGLVLLTSIAMAVAVVRLGRQRVLVQELPAVEVLARVDVICIDKTGTLTEPGMRVRDVVELASGAPVHDALGALGAADEHPNPTMGAVAAAFPPAKSWDPQERIAFSSSRKWSATRFADRGWWILGAPEMLLDRGDPLRAQVDELAATGSRVLLLAQSFDGIEPDGDDMLDVARLSAVALVVVDQKLRPDVPDTVRFFLEQGVTLKVLSGDNPVTVGAYAREAGIPGADDPVDARDLPTDLAALADLLDARSVFGRVAPEQKRAMVRALQSHGHVVAMTGDGVNDVLALKDADLGIAMGSGAAATRAAAQLVLLDNRFSVMPSVVAEGRRVLGNIERVADLFVTKSIYALMLVVLTGVFSVPFPHLPRHLTVVTALTIGVPAFFLALMPNTNRFRSGFFARVLTFAVPAGITCAAMTFAAYRVELLTSGTSVSEARVSATITLALMAWFVLYLVARPMDPTRWLIVVTMAIGFVLVLFVPVLSRFFALTLKPDPDIALSVLLGVVGCCLLWVIQWFAKRRRAVA